MIDHSKVMSSVRDVPLFMVAQYPMASNERQRCALEAYHLQCDLLNPRTGFC
jgi:hypothetical protein